MSDLTASALESLLSLLLEELRARPAGLSEYELLRRLDQRGIPPFAGADLQRPESLYRTHFRLFHCLYLLQERLRAAGEELHIHCLSIRIGRRAEAEPGALAAPDPLRAYYLDERNLTAVTGEEVEAMLASFWRWFHAQDARRAALVELGLSDPASPAEIKRAYRRLVMQHHPDRGGDTARLQALNAAMAQLEQG